LRSDLTAMKLAVTGAAGFLGWHVRCALRARGGYAVRMIDRAEWADPQRLDAALAGVDAVLHLAGANRGDPDGVRADNERLAGLLTDALDRVGGRPAVVYANSIQAGNGTPFGTGKQAAAEQLGAWGGRAGAAVCDVRLPNLFGEHGRPRYNSVVATFCAALVAGEPLVVEQDRELPLLHVQDAADMLIELAGAARGGVVEPAGRPVSVTALRDLLTGFHTCYATGEIPVLSDPLHRALFNTYRSFTFPAHYPIRPAPHRDERGTLFECVRAHDGPAQVFCSTTRPGQTRGQHFHLRKIERFLVLQGSGEIALRRLFDDEIVRFAVNGAEPAIIDMPTMWAHSITNTGTAELTTLFWADELLDPARPDTYPERVEPAELSAFPGVGPRAGADNSRGEGAS
jgi:UDP-2-acetamido-2,6-beta-L-arabino-hexul-4-ose reductase